jgi:phage anti-repressor protein
MEKLIKKVTINGEEQMGVNARDLWEALKSKRQFGNWIQDRLVGFEEGVDFTVNKIVNGENKGRFAATEYTLTLDTAKHLAMLERNEIGKQIRQYFIEFEKEARKALEDGIKFCQKAYVDKCTCTVMPPSASLRETTVELLNDINLRLLAGESVDKEILRYAWNVGRMFSKPVTLENSSVPIDILEFAETLTPGEYSRGEIYEAYCKHCANPSAARWFWPRLRQACPFTEKRTRYRRMIIIGE